MTFQSCSGIWESILHCAGLHLSCNLLDEDLFNACVLEKPEKSVLEMCQTNIALAILHLPSGDFH